MTAPITITATLAAWFSPSEWDTLDRLMEKVETGKHLSAIQSLAFVGSPSTEKFAEYMRIGEADITVRLLPRDEQTRMALNALNAKLDMLRAAYLQKQQEIMDQISKLTAITNEVEA